MDKELLTDLLKVPCKLQSEEKCNAIYFIPALDFDETKGCTESEPTASLTSQGFRT